MSRLRIRTLGGLDVEVDGGPLSAPVPAKGRALLAYLAVVGGRADRSRLAGLLWSDLPEASARQNLRLVLTHLRRAIDHVHADRTTVWFDGAWSVDTADAETLSVGDAPSADPGEVLSLVRGEFLDGVDEAGAELFGEWVAGRRAHLRTVTLALLGAIVTHALAGDIPPTSGIAAARRMLELEPADETAHRALMQLFADAGQTSAALAQFDTCMHVLYEELGERPTEQTAALADDIRHHTAALPRTTPRLPPRRSSFVGRDAELDRLDQLLADPSCRLVTVVGAGGIGKTRLALEFARAWTAADRPAAFVSFAGVAPGDGRHLDEAVVTTLAAGLDLELEAGRDPFDVLVDRIRGRPGLLLVVDNLEHVIGAGRVLTRVLDAAPRLRVLATSRRRLAVGRSGCCRWKVSPRPTPTAPATRGVATPSGCSSSVPTPPGADGISTRSRSARCATRSVGSPWRSSSPLVGRPWCRYARSARDSTTRSTCWRDRRTPNAGTAASGPPWTGPGSCSIPRSRTASAACRCLPAASRRRPPIGSPASACCSCASWSSTHCSRSTPTGGTRCIRWSAGTRRSGSTARRRAPRTSAAGTRCGSPDRWRRPTAPRSATTRPIWTMSASRPAGCSSTQRTRSSPATCAPSPRPTVGGRGGRSCARPSQRRWPGVPCPPMLRAEWLMLLAEAHGNIGRPADGAELAWEAMAALGRPLPDSSAQRLRWVLTDAATTVAWRLGLLSTADHREVARRREIYLHRTVELALISGQFDRVPPLLLAGVEGRVSADPSALALADIGACGSARVAGRTARARRYRDRALARLDDGTIRRDVAAQMLLTATDVSLVLGDWDDATRDAARALDICDSDGLHRQAEGAILHDTVARYHTGDHTAVTAQAHDALARASRRGATTVLTWAELLIAESALRTGQLGRATAAARRALELAPTVELRIDRLRALVVLGRAAVAADRWDDASILLSDAADALTDRAIFLPSAVEGYAGVPELALDLLEADRGGGDLDLILRRGTAVLRSCAAVVRIAAPRLHLVEGRLAELRGRRAAARRSYDRAATAANRLAMPWELHEAARRLASVARR